MIKITDNRTVYIDIPFSHVEPEDTFIVEGKGNTVYMMLKDHTVVNLQYCCVANFDSNDRVILVDIEIGFK